MGGASGSGGLTELGDSYAESNLLNDKMSQAAFENKINALAVGYFDAECKRSDAGYACPVGFPLFSTDTAAAALAKKSYMNFFDRYEENNYGMLQTQVTATVGESGAAVPFSFKVHDWTCKVVSNNNQDFGAASTNAVYCKSGSGSPVVFAPDFSGDSASEVIPATGVFKVDYDANDLGDMEGFPPQRVWDYSQIIGKKMVFSGIGFIKKVSPLNGYEAEIVSTESIALSGGDANKVATDIATAQLGESQTWTNPVTHRTIKLGPGWLTATTRDADGGVDYLFKNNSMPIALKMSSEIAENANFLSANDPFFHGVERKYGTTLVPLGAGNSQIFFGPLKDSSDYARNAIAVVQAGNRIWLIHVEWPAKAGSLPLGPVFALAQSTR